jgi:dTDP-4-dehydrorhamnose 3,5-epimerase
MKSKIEGVGIKRLTTHYDDRGMLCELLRNDDQYFQKFGQVYMSTTMPNVVKGFHKHSKQCDNIACVRGKLKLVLIDDTKDALHAVVEEYILVPGGLLITIPPQIWHGWKNVGTTEAIAINAPTEAFNPDNPDEERNDPHKMMVEFYPKKYYSWETKDR